MKTRYKILILLPMLLMLNSLLAEQQHISQGEMLVKVFSVIFQFLVFRVVFFALLLLFFQAVWEKLFYYIELYYTEE